MLHPRLLWLLAVTIIAPTVSGAEPGSEIPVLVEQQRLLGAEGGARGSCSVGGASRSTGTHVALYGDTAVLGQQWCGSHDGNDQTPATVVFSRDQGFWSETARLRPSSAVLLHGDTLAMRDPSFESVYVYTRTGDTWVEQARLISSDGQESNVGRVALSGDVLAVKFYSSVYILQRSEDDYKDSSIHIFHRNEGTWMERARLEPNSAADRFGSLELSGDTLAVSGYESASETRSVHIFKRNGDTWIEQAKLTDFDLPNGARLGGSLALSGDTLLVQEARDDNTPASTGSAHVFTRNGESWNYQTKLTPSGNIDYGRFLKPAGVSVTLTGNTAILQSIGVSKPETTSDGMKTVVAAVTVFIRSGENWIEQTKLATSSGSSDKWRDGYGWNGRVTASGSTVLLGASGMSSLGGIPEADGYVYDLSSITSTAPEENLNPETPEAVLSEQSSADSGGGAFGYLLILLLGFMRMRVAC
jgi:hypothetical protein